MLLYVKSGGGNWYEQVTVTARARNKYGNLHCYSSTNHAGSSQGLVDSYNYCKSNLSFYNIWISYQIQVEENQENYYCFHIMNNHVKY